MPIEQHESTDLETLAQRIVAVNPEAILKLTLNLLEYSDESITRLRDLGFATSYLIQRHKILIGKIPAMRFLNSLEEIRKIAIPSPPSVLEVQ